MKDILKELEYIHSKQPNKEFHEVIIAIGNHVKSAAYVVDNKTFMEAIIQYKKVNGI